MKRIELASIPEEGLHIEESLEEEELDLKKAGITVSSLQLDAFLQRLGTEVLVQGNLRGSMSLCCSRCLDEYEHSFQLPFKTHYVPAAKETEQQTDYEEEEQPNTIHFHAEDIDLRDDIRQNLLLEVPIKPLCHEGCKGLCPQCGANLNDNPCQCDRPSEETPFGRLKELI